MRLPLILYITASFPHKLHITTPPTDDSTTTALPAPSPSSLPTTQRPALTLGWSDICTYNPMDVHFCKSLCPEISHED